MSEFFSLGLGGSIHDFSACLVRNGEIHTAVADERVTRIKYACDHALLTRAFRDWAAHGPSYLATLQSAEPCRPSAEYCLSKAHLRISEVDAIAFSMPARFYGSLLPSDGKPRRMAFNHHLAHAASSFFLSPFEDAAIIVADGAGHEVNWRGQKLQETLSTYVGRGSTLYEYQKIGEPSSLGHFYQAITLLIGFKALETGKTMALASFGSRKLFDRMRQLLTLYPDGTFALRGFDFAHSCDLNAVGQLLAKVLEISEADMRAMPPSLAEDLAFASQALVEEAMLHVARHLATVVKTKNLCLAGGVALNSVCNWRLLNETPFERIFVQPASSDDGLALGNALLGYFASNARANRGMPMRNAYLGASYSEDEIVAALRNGGDKIAFRKCHGVADEAARLIAGGAVVAWFQGGAEFGPRALGNRSILADARRPDMKEQLNRKVKFREPFRPFAPAVLEQHVSDYFKIDQPSPYMLLVVPARAQVRHLIPSALHVDGTARLQTVSSSENPLLHELLQSFYRLTRIPIVINTSFNVANQPIVETPQDALFTLLNTQIDFLALGDYLVWRRETTPEPFQNVDLA